MRLSAALPWFVLAAGFRRTGRDGRVRRPDDGMVTAETAVVLPVLVLLAFVGIAAVGVGQARIRCADAAREAARAVARGDPGAADRLARAAAGPGVTVTATATGAGSGESDTVVTARLRVRPLSWLPAIEISETAVVSTEPAPP